jgi:hypothetical protein
MVVVDAASPIHSFILVGILSFIDFIFVAVGSSNTSTIFDLVRGFD